MSRKSAAPLEPAAPAVSDSRIPGSLVFPLLLIWWVALGLFYYHQPQLSLRWELAARLIPNPLDIKPHMLWELLKLLAQIGWLVFLGATLGGLGMVRLGLKPRSPMELFGFGLGLGWGALAYAMALLGLCKLWYPVPIYASLAVLTALAAFGAHRTRLHELRTSAGAWSRSDIALTAILASFAGLNLFCALMPEIFYDALTCHLSLPDLYWRGHGFYPIADNAFSGVPMLVQMLFALALPVGGDRLAHLIHWAFGLLSALAAYDFARRFASPRAGLLAALLFYSNPLVGVMSWKSAVDLGVCFFQFISLYALAMAFTEKERQPRWLALAGLLAGFTMGTKYQAWPLAGIMTAALFWQLRAQAKGGPVEWLREAAPFLALTAAASVIWPLRNWLLYGNPIFPFYQERFSSWGSRVDWRGMLADGGRDWKAMLGSWPGLREFLLSPWHLSTQALDTRTFGPIFLLGLPLLAVARFRTEAERILLALMLALWASWSLTNWVPRYFLPTFLLAAVLYASAFERVLLGGAKKTAYALLLYVLCVNFFWTAAWFQTYEAEGVVLGTQKAEDYLRGQHPSYGHPYYACADHINRNLPPRARILILGDERGYFIRRDYVAATVFAEHPLARYVRESPSPERLRAVLSQDGITHILVNTAKINELGLEHWLKLDAGQAAVLSGFDRGYKRQLYPAEPVGSFSSPSPIGCAVYEISR